MSKLSLTAGNKEAFEREFKSLGGFLLKRRLSNMFPKSFKSKQLAEFQENAKKIINRTANIARFRRAFSLIFVIPLIVLAFKGGGLLQAIKDYLNEPKKHADKLNKLTSGPELAANIVRQMAKLKATDPEAYSNHKKLLRADENSNWKDTLFGADYSKIVASKKAEVEPDYRAAEAEFDILRYAVAESNNEAKGAAIMGTTFVSNVASILARNGADQGPVVAHIMDSAFVAEAAGDRILVAIGDGLGGHTGDVHQDNAITRASYFASKHAVRLMSHYKNADELNAALPKIIERIAEEVKLKMGDFKEGTSLTAAVAFKIPGRDNMRVVGFSIGDSQMISYSPSIKMARNLLPAKQMVQSMGKGPAHFPVNYNPDNEVEIVDTIIPADSVLLPMTDGISDEFKAKVTKIDIDGQSYYENSSVDVSDIKHVLDRAANSQANSQATAQEFAQAIVNESMDRAQGKVAQRLDQSKGAEEAMDSIKGEGEAIAQADSALNTKFEDAAKEKDEGALDDTAYQAKREQLSKEKAGLKERRAVFIESMQKLQMQQEIRCGDDIGIVAARFSN